MSIAIKWVTQIFWFLRAYKSYAYTTLEPFKCAIAAPWEAGAPWRWLAAGMAGEKEDPTFEEENEEIGGGAEGGQGKRKRLFSKELRCMMYGFGDDQNPYAESVDILEDLVIEFITEMTHKAMSIGRQGRVQVEDIVFLIRKDPRKFARVKDLLTMNEELKRARKAFDEANYGS